MVVTVDNRYAYVADYWGHAIDAYAVQADGSLAALAHAPLPNAETPENVAATSDGRFVYVTTLSNTIAQYAIGSDGQLAPLSPPEFTTGLTTVDSLAIDSTGRFVYIGDATQRAVSQFSIGSDGTLQPLHPPSVPAGFPPASLTVSPDGTTLCVGDLSTGLLGGEVGLFAIGKDGRLSALPVSGPVTAQHLRTTAIAPDGSSFYALTASGIQQFVRGADGSLATFATAVAPAASGSNPWHMAVR
jgi:6-phosphogluconolactonase (cycloisomerase 2 family)